MWVGGLNYDEKGGGRGTGSGCWFDVNKEMENGLRK